MLLKGGGGAGAPKYAAVAGAQGTPLPGFMVDRLAADPHTLKKAR